MNANQKPLTRCRIQGNLLRLGTGREVAIYLRDGSASVAEFSSGQGELHAPGDWMSVNGRRLVHAQRRGEVEIVAPIPEDVAERIEGLHRLAAGASPAARLARFAVDLGNRLARLPLGLPTR